MFQNDFPTEKLRPASYNPRAIASDALEGLKRSIQEVGFAKPIIVTRDSLIIAGHQRTKAARALGIDRVPAWVLKEISVTDEVRFNQLHNGTDLDEIDQPVYVKPSSSLGYEMVPGASVEGNLRSTGAIIRREICSLIAKYGNWGCAVATKSGRIISSPQYALACKILGIDCRVYRIEDNKVASALGHFGRQYGEFSYDHLTKNTYIQTLAQMYRLREDSEKVILSRLYENHVMLTAKKTDRILDFGCGQADYVKKLRAEGWDIRGLEFFYRRGNLLDTTAVHAMIDQLCDELVTHGLYDTVVCDSVLNSVDSRQAELDVLHCISAFCKPGGTVYFSGRCIDTIESENRTTKSTGNGGGAALKFLDKDGFTAQFRKGSWFYQKFHDKRGVHELATTLFNPRYHLTWDGSWQVRTKKAIELPQEVLEESIRREFNLPWPDGQSVGRSSQVLGAYRKAVSKKG